MAADGGGSSADGRVQALTVLKDLLAERLAADSEGKQTAGLSREYRAVLSELETLSKSERKGSRVDELARKRKARDADAEGAVPAKRRGPKLGS